MNFITGVVVLFSCVYSVAAQYPIYSPIVPNLFPGVAPVPVSILGTSSTSGIKNFQSGLVPGSPLGSFTNFIRDTGPVPVSVPFPSPSPINQIENFLSGPVNRPIPVAGLPGDSVSGLIPTAGTVSGSVSNKGSVSPPTYRTENFRTSTLAKSELRDGAGQYSLSYVTADGIQVTDRSYLKLGLHGDYIPVREGMYQYISPEGIPIGYAYKADENGFVVKDLTSRVTPTSV